MAPAGFEPAVPASERSQTHALDRAMTGLPLGYRNTECTRQDILQTVTKILRTNVDSRTLSFIKFEVTEFC
jgi:hypothetical protein